MTISEWECMDCGYLYEGRQRPGECPDCGAADAWEKVADIYFVEVWECRSCKHLCELNPPPGSCPECGATDAWEKVELAETQELNAADFEDESGEQQVQVRTGGNGSKP